MPRCISCDEPIKEGQYCLPCKLQEESIDSEEPVIFERFKKEKVKEK